MGNTLSTGNNLTNTQNIDNASSAQKEMVKTAMSGENEHASTEQSPHDIYDRMFKRILTLSSTAVIHFINGLFHMDYPENSVITYNATESVDSNLQKRLADKILTVNHTDSYHFEAEMGKDHEIVIRIMEYGFQYALRNMSPLPHITHREEAVSEPWKSYFRFPRQIVIYLDQETAIPEEYTVEVQFPGEGSFEHRIPVLYFQKKTLEEIKQDNLVILLPFRLLQLRKEIEKERSLENAKRLIELSRNDIIEPINQAYSIGVITKRDRLILLALAKRLEKHLYQKYDDIWEAIQNMIVRDHSLPLDIDVYEDMLDEKDAKMEIMAEQIEEKDAQIEAKDALLAEKEAEILQLKEQLKALKEQS